MTFDVWKPPESLASFVRSVGDFFSIWQWNEESDVNNSRLQNGEMRSFSAGGWTVRSNECKKSGKAATLSVGGGWTFWNNKRRTGGKQEKGTVDPELWKWTLIERCSLWLSWGWTCTTEGENEIFILLEVTQLRRHYFLLDTYGLRFSEYWTFGCLCCSCQVGSRMWRRWPEWGTLLRQLRDSWLNRTRVFVCPCVVFTKFITAGYQWEGKSRIWIGDFGSSSTNRCGYFVASWIEWKTSRWRWRPLRSTGSGFSSLTCTIHWLFFFFFDDGHEWNGTRFKIVVNAVQSSMAVRTRTWRIFF